MYVVLIDFHLDDPSELSQWHYTHMYA